MVNRLGTACIVALSSSCSVCQWSLWSHTTQIVAPSSNQILIHLITTTLIFMHFKVWLNRVLRIFGPRKDEVTGEWRKLHNEELNDLYCSSNIVLVIKSRRMR